MDASHISIFVGCEAADAEAAYLRQVKERRCRVLDILLIGALGCSLILAAMLAWIYAQPRPPLRDITQLTMAVPAMLATIAICYALARWISTDVASVFLLIAAIIIITLSDKPGQIALGPGLIAYAVPILAAGVLLPPWSAFAVAGLSALAVLAASIISSYPALSVPPIVILFMLALTTWYFAHTLERSTLALRDANVRLLQDIAERKRMEARLRLMSHVVEQSPVSIALMGQDGKLEYVNSQFLKMTGLSNQDVARLTWRDLQPPDAPSNLDMHVQAVLAAGSQFRAQARRQRADGEWYWEAISISVVHDADSDERHFLAIAEDVTARKEAEDALRNVNAELERRVEARTAELRRANVELEHSARLKAVGEHVALQTALTLCGGRRPLILLAEDNKPSIETVLNFLEPLGCKLLVVQRGDDAVRTAYEQRPDLILMDSPMPHLDGLSAIRRIRGCVDPAVAKIPIIALTALAMPGDREWSLAAGADEYLSKPFTMRVLVQAIRRLI